MVKFELFGALWQFGTINEDGSPNGCNAPNILNYLINIPVREVFYDPPVPAIAYTPLPTPPAVLMGTNITIDLYEVQQSVLLYQEK
ncbi:3941_t:CDS:2 [Ambispora gerdemannii]|uniref:3941_t:CDS:1 n=1 Tax=Ambispora gerdemannii TaxID=144530 RepID=A0A9N9CXV6_9GLOM|nr:3941_t:CDS:2 [Ambispora gerdemannii]